MNRKIKILYITEPTSAGVGKHIMDILNNINTEKFEVHFIYSSIRSDENFKERMKKLEKSNINFYKINMVREIKPINDFRAFREIVKCIRTINPDVIHCHSSKAGFIGRIAGTICGTKVKVYSPHAFPFNDYINKYKKLLYMFLEKFAGIFTTAIVATSETEYHQAIDNNIVDKSKLALIYNGIDIDDYKNKVDKEKTFESLGISKCANKDTKIIGFISRLVQQKDRSVHHIYRYRFNCESF